MWQLGGLGFAAATLFAILCVFSDSGDLTSHFGKAQQDGFMFPLRSICMTLVGLIGVGLAAGALNSPEKVAAEYGTGWLFRQFGIYGVAGALVLIGLPLFIAGIIGIRRYWRARKWRSIG